MMHFVYVTYLANPNSRILVPGSSDFTMYVDANYLNREQNSEQFTLITYIIAQTQFKNPGEEAGTCSFSEAIYKERRTTDKNG